MKIYSYQELNEDINPPEPEDNIRFEDISSDFEVEIDADLTLKDLRDNLELIWSNEDWAHDEYDDQTGIHVADKMDVMEACEDYILDLIQRMTMTERLEDMISDDIEDTEVYHVSGYFTISYTIEDVGYREHSDQDGVYEEDLIDDYASITINSVKPSELVIDPL